MSKAKDSPEVIIIDSLSDDDFQPSTSKKTQNCQETQKFFGKTLQR